MSDSSPITKNGYEKIQTELNQLITVDREQLKTAIQEARELGDLKENAEYHAAKEKQALNEGRIQHLQSIIANSQVIDISQVNAENIVFGATVTLFDVEKDVEVKYQVVGEDEADISKGKISFKSPLGRSLIGKEEGDSVTVKAPKGDIEYEIVSVEYV